MPLAIDARLVPVMKLNSTAETQSSFAFLDWLLSIGMALTWGSSFLLIKIAIRDFDSERPKEDRKRTLATTADPWIRMDGISILPLSTS